MGSKEFSKEKKNKKRLLIADNNPALLYSAISDLNQMSSDWEVRVVTTGESCLKYLKNNPVDIIILDLMLPDNNGWNIASEIRKRSNTKEIPIIFLASNKNIFCQIMQSLSPEDFIEKPFDFLELDKALRSKLKQE